MIIPVDFGLYFEPYPVYYFPFLPPPGSLLPVVPRQRCWFTYLYALLPPGQPTDSP